MGKKKRALKAIAFSAYPSHPESAAEAHREAAKKLTLTHSIRVLTWEECRIGGKIIIQELCRTIQHTPLFIADVTALNPNVLFELGYAIAKKRRLWLLLDESVIDSKRNFETFHLLTSIGYRPYCNSNDVVSALMREQPWHDLKATIPLRATRSERGQAGKLLYLKSRVSQLPVRLRNRMSH